MHIQKFKLVAAIALELTKYFANGQTLGTGSASFSTIVQNNCLNMSKAALMGFVMLH